MSIPKLIHQIWLQGWDTLPERFSTNIQLLKDMNPDFERMTWDEDSLRTECAKLSPKVLATFDSFPYLIQKVDLGRYVVLYNYGGVSVDTDMKSLKSLRTTPHFSDHEFIVSYSAFPASIVGIVNNALIMCKKNHPILLELITSICESDLKESDFVSKELYINATTSPYKFNTIVYKHRNDVYTLDHRYFEPCFSVDPLCSPGRDSIMDHKHELSWFHGATKIMCQILIVLLYFLFFIVLPITVIVILLTGKGASKQFMWLTRT